MVVQIQLWSLIVSNVIEVNKTFKAAKIDPFAVSADNGQTAYTLLCDSSSFSPTPATRGSQSVCT